MTWWGRGFRVLVALLAVVGAIALAVLATAVVALWPHALTPATPPLLRSVRAGSGWSSGGCPRPTVAKFDFRREALSPDLTARLAAAFPPGSDADVLEAAMRAQGMRMEEPCRDDPMIRRAGFSQKGGGLLGPYPMSATIAWRRTAEGRIEWTKGFVFYSAP